jgi:glutathione S-transferase
MALVFYYAPMSSSVPVHWALEELGVPYEKVKIDIKGARDQDKAGYRALNPNGKVPLLVHDGTPIFESLAIILHLGEAFGVEKGLFPAAGLERSQAFKWMAWAGVSLGGAISRFLHSGSPMIPEEQRNANAAAVAKTEVEALFGTLENELAKRSWLVTESFSLADLHVAAWVGYAGIRGFDTKSLPKIAAWMEKSTSRRSHRAAFSP